MPIKLDISVDIGNFLSRTLDVVIRVDSDISLPPFRFELLVFRPNIHLKNLQIMDFQGQVVDYFVVGGEITFASRKFEILYSVVVDYSECVGVDRATEFNFPFINDSEIFFSTGLFPFPEYLHSVDREIRLTFHVNGKPANWQVFSSLDIGKLTVTKLDNFFWYAAPELNPSLFILRGRETIIRFHILSQPGKEIPISFEEFSEFLSQYLNWIEKNVAPYRQLADINCLILQAPPNYEQLTQNTSFATGENVINGIIAYGPDDPAAYQILGSATYRDYLFEGIAHEIMHLYTTTSVQGRHKSVLYPANDCPPAHARLIGESLNLYFVYQFVGEYLQDSMRLKNRLKFHLNQALKSGRRNGLLDLYLLDQSLKDKGSSLLNLFSALIKWKQAFPGPFSSVEIIFEALRERLGVEVSNEIEDLVLGPSTPDYNMLVHF